LIMESEDRSPKYSRSHSNCGSSEVYKTFWNETDTFSRKK
jgi:hypothetical protein